MNWIVSLCFGVFLHTCFYYLLLIMLLPYLRGRISARACALLWMLPNLLFYMLQNFMEVEEPLLILSVKGPWVPILLGVWLIGVVGVLTWKIAEHLMFRRQILADAEEIRDEAIREIWEEELRAAKVDWNKYKLVRSPEVRTPVTVGLFGRSLRVVMPCREYSPEDLRMIFRHELIHICREDAWSKFFLVFCTALCWFNPLMWYAMKKCAEDLELSCDETVLLGAEEETRRRYAELLLETAGENRGFTTCLSASAQTMRYRLKHVIKPRSRYKGAIAVAVIGFFLFMTSGYVALAYGGRSGEALLMSYGDRAVFDVRNVSRTEAGSTVACEVEDPEALIDYLSGLTYQELTRGYRFRERDRVLVMTVDTPKGTLRLYLSDHLLEQFVLFEGYRKYYYIPEELDWGYLEGLLTEMPET